MGKHWILACSTFLLFGCAPGQASTSSIPEPTPEPSVSEVSAETLSAFLTKASKGFKAEGVFRQGSEAAYYTGNCVDVAIGTTASTMTTYAKVIEPGTPTRNNGSTYRYEMYPYGGKLVTTLAELGIDNVVDRYFATDGSGAYLEWGTTTFSSFFYDVSVEDFTQDGDTFVLKMDDPSLSDVYVGVGSQLSGYTGLTLSSFELTFGDGEYPSYKAAFEPYQSSTIGLTNSGVSGVFTYAGEEACAPLEPLPAGEADPIFEAAIKKLQAGDYSFDIEGTATHIKGKADDGKATTYELFDSDDNKTAAYGYRNIDSAHVQGLITINGKVYPDGPAIEGQLSMMLPSFAMSPIFFDKETTDEGTLYTLKEGTGAVCNYYDYGMMVGETVGTIKLLVKTDSVVVTNEFGGAKETFTYSDFGTVEGLLDTLQENGDALTWKDVLSNDLAEYAVLLETIPEAALAAMPIVGGQYNYFTCDASYKPGHPVFIYSFASYDYDEAYAVRDGYEAKLVSAGFVKQSQTGVNNGSVYSKPIEIEGENYSLDLEVLVGVGLLSAPRFLIYPSLTK